MLIGICNLCNAAYTYGVRHRAERKRNVVYTSDIMRGIELFRRSEQQQERPLRLLDNAHLNTEQLQRFQKLQDFDLSQVQGRLYIEDRFPTVWIPEATLEFKRYMGLYIAGGIEHSVSMFSPEIDEVWHGLILHTRMYQKFCQEMFGTFLHHNPFESGDPNPHENWQDFQIRYETLYGPVTHLWTLHQSIPS